MLEMVQQHLNRTIHCLRHHGFLGNLKKSHLMSSQTIEHLGALINTKILFAQSWGSFLAIDRTTTNSWGPLPIPPIQLSGHLGPKSGAGLILGLQAGGVLCGLCLYTPVLLPWGCNCPLTMQLQLLWDTSALAPF